MGVGHPHSVQMWKLRTREVKRHIQGHTASQGIATQDPLPAKPLLFRPITLYLLQIHQRCTFTQGQDHLRVRGTAGSVTHCPVGPEFLSTTDMIIFCCGTILCIVECLTTPLASINQMPVTSPPPVMTTKNVCRYCQMFPGAGDKMTRLRNTVLNQIGVWYYRHALSYFLKNGLYVALS